MTATCELCGRTEDLDRAVETGWRPDYYDATGQPHGPACPSCAAVHLVPGDDGEYELVWPQIIN